MSKLFFSLGLLLALNFASFAQANEQTLIKWEQYAFKKQGFSVALPKLPIVVAENDYKRSEETEKFGAFSKGVAYVVSYSFEAKDNPLKKYEPVEPFTEQNFAARAEQIRNSFAKLNEEVKESEFLENGWRITELKSDKTIYKLYLNQQNKSWIELLAVHPNDSAADAKKFFDSLKLEKQPQGKEVGNGADYVIGDAAPQTPFSIKDTQTPATAPTVAPPQVLPSNGLGNGNGIGNARPAKTELQNQVKAQVSKLRIVMKSRPGYTDEARKSNISGTVVLRLIFSAAGTVSSVQIVKGLPYGLTERAVAASRKMLFVPEKRGGVPVSVSKSVEYNFSLY